MSKTLGEPLTMDNVKEGDNLLPPHPETEYDSVCNRDIADERALTEKPRQSPEEEVKPEKSPSKELKPTEEAQATTEDVSLTGDSSLDHQSHIKQSGASACRHKQPMLAKSLDSIEKLNKLRSENFSDDFIVPETSKFCEKSQVCEKREGSESTAETESFISSDSSVVTCDLENPKSAEFLSGSVNKKIPEQTDKPPASPLSSENGETSKKEESLAASAPTVDGAQFQEEAKRTARMQSDENAVDNVNSGKLAVLKPCPSVSTNLEGFTANISPGTRQSAGGHQVNVEVSAMVEEAWEMLKKSYVYFKGRPVGTLAAMDPSAEELNYNQVFVRDFVPCGLACLMSKKEAKSSQKDYEIVKNFLLKTLHLQGWEKRIDNFTLGEGVMPASFKVLYDSHRQKDILVADFGGTAIGRVAPVDSGFWWIILLRSYTRCTLDYALAERPEVQKGMKLILNLCLSDGFDTFPTLLCADGCSMIDRRMGIYGYPIEIQALFYFALRCARRMIKPERDGKELIERIDKRIGALSYHIQTYYWLDFPRLNNIYRYKTEEYSHTAVNKFNVIPESIPDWLFDFIPLRGGYLIGNVSPARMDFRWFLVGNCIAILSSLVTPAQATAIMDLVEERWEELIGEMPLKITYPALEGHEWRVVTGFDPKNSRWSYHNGGSWPVLLWLLTAACIKIGRPQIAKQAIELAEQRLSKDGWPEYYDGKTGRYIGKQARKYQTWTIAGYLVAKMMIENPSNLLLISLEEDKKITKPRLTRSNSF